MELVRLTPDSNLSGFDCGDSDLNNFLVEDAKSFLDKRIANSFILLDEGRLVAYFCILNDKISRQEVTNSQWRTIKNKFPVGKQFSSYPAIKIGRFAVSVAYRRQNIGTKLMNIIKDMLNSDRNYSAFRFITVDAYLSAMSFYQKNGFVELTEKDRKDHTRLMFFDMMELP
ncbi:MAG: GNAT family N-acetyltransferase [Muribaculaceae bacterium]|nr:GNAT family N-acetyltransferase [Muribaculaceae bacterium]